MIDLLCFALAGALSLLAMWMCIKPRRRAAPLARVLEFPTKQERVQFKTRRRS